MTDPRTAEPGVDAGGRIPDLGQDPERMMTYDHIGRYLASLTTAGLAPSSVRNAFFVIKGVMDEAVKQRLIRANPCHDVDRPAVRTPESYELQVAEVEGIIQRVTDDAGTRWGLLVATAAYTGPRSGELAGFRVKRLNVTARTVDVRETVTDLNGSLKVGSPKSNAGKRTVGEVPESLCLDLARYLATPRPGRPAGLLPDDYVFGSVADDGTPRPYRHGNFYRRVFAPAVRALGMPCAIQPDRKRRKKGTDKEPKPAKLTGPAVRFHDLRHFYAAMLLTDPDTTLKDAQAQMGHTTLALLADQYAHLLAASGAGRGGRVDEVRRTGQAEAAKRASGANVVPLRPAHEA